MKRLITLVLLFITANTMMAQNMVPNGSFENYSNCPIGLSGIGYGVATGWLDYHESCDYFNTCHTSLFSTASVPLNQFGWQHAASGNGYMGIINGVYSSSDDKETAMRNIVPLSIEAKYEVSMSVSLSNRSGMSTNDLGVWFYDVGPDTTLVNVFGPMNVIPQVSYSGYGNITDTQNWVRLIGYMTADSAYYHIVIGGFGDINTSNFQPTGHGWSVYATTAYYYIDSVVVKLASGINNLYLDSLVCAGDTFFVPYSLNTNYKTYNTGNVFTVQLSDTSGSFAIGTTIIGSLAGNTAGSIPCVVPNTVFPGNKYRIRILSTNNVDTSGNNIKAISIGVLRPSKPVASNNTPICSGDTIRLYASTSTSNVSYRWTGPSSFVSHLQNPIKTSAVNSNSGNYIVTARLFGCVSKDTTSVYVSVGNPNHVSAYSNTPICTYDTLKLNATVQVTANSYTWTGPQSFSSINKDAILASASTGNSGNYVFTAYYTGCTIRDTVNVLVKPVASNRVLNVNSTTLCSGKTLQLNASSSTTGVNYTWQGPNSFGATTQNVTLSNINTNMTGRYFVAYELNGCIVKDSVSVTVNPSPSAIIASTNAPVCQGDTVRLYSTNSTSGVVWNWSGVSGFGSLSKDTFFSGAQLSQSGYYTVSATNSYNCKSIDSVHVLVKPLPANVNAGTNAPICEGNTLFLTGNTSSSGVSFSWNGPNSFSSTLQNPNFSSATTNRTGNYVLTATLNGCSVIDTVYAQVNPIPSTPTPSANTPVCVGQDLLLGASTVAGATYSWTGVGGFTSSIQYPVRNSSTTAYAGKYYVTAIANGCTSLADSILLTVNPAPVINMYPSPKDSICVGQSVMFVSSTGNTGSSFTRNWFKNNTVIGGAANANYSTTTAADGDEYYITLTAYGVCATPYTDTSNIIRMHVLPWLAPSVSITANPNTTVASGTMINFTATPTNGGNKPGYQWTRNGAPVVGATSNIWGASTLSNNDQICVDMTSNYLCPNPKTAKSNCIKVSIESTGIVGVWSGATPSIYPNPTKDKLLIEGIEKGTIIQLNDVFGRVVIKATAANETAELNMSHLAAGSYMLLLSKDNGDRMSVKVVKE